MERAQWHRISAWLVRGLAFLALGTVIIGYTQPPLPDEGTLAHIFQLTIVALLPAGLFFLGTAGWRQPARSARTLALPGAVVLLAFGALYYLEHYWY